MSSSGFILDLLQVVCVSSMAQISFYVALSRGRKKQLQVNPRLACPDTYSYLEVHRLFGEARHVVVEAKSVFSDIVRREDIVCLSFFFPRQHFAISWPCDYVIDVEVTARLYLQVRTFVSTSVSVRILRHWLNVPILQSKMRSSRLFALPLRRSSPSRSLRPCTSAPSRRRMQPGRPTGSKLLSCSAFWRPSGGRSASCRAGIF